MHSVQYNIYPQNTKREDILAEINEIVQDGTDWGCDYYEYGKLTRNDHWHESRIYKNKEEALEAIRRYDNGFYDDHAVLFHDTDAAKETAKTKAIIERIGRIRQRLLKLEADTDVHNRKSATITCRHCDSRINLAYYHGRHDCPVCGGDMRSQTTLNRIAEVGQTLVSAKKQLQEERDRQSGECPVMWLVKFEYHC